MKQVILALLAAFFLASCSRSSVEVELLAGGAPDVMLQSLNGKMVRIADYEGKVILVDFWATWCPPCQEMVPQLSKLHENYASQGLVILGIALDREGAKIVEPFVRKYEINYMILLGDMETAEAFGGISSIPTTFIIDREGRLVRKLPGYHSERELAAQIKKYL